MLNDLRGISGARLYPVSCNDLTVIVSDISKTGFVADQSKAIEFAGTIESMAQFFTLLPVRFGSLMNSTDAIKEMIERNATEIRQNLLKVENKVEFGLKTLCDSEKLKAALSAESEQKIPTHQETDGEIKISVFKEYMNQKLKEHRLEEILLAYVDSVIVEISEYLKKMNALVKFKKMVTANIIIDAVFLLDTELKDELIQSVKEFQSLYPSLGFVLTGPWPPYNFVDFTIK